MKKKLLSVVLAASMVLSLAACGGGGDAQPAETPAATETKEETTAVEDTTAADTTEAVAEEPAAGPDERGMQDGKFVDTRHIRVELYDRNVDGGTEAGNNAWTKWIQEQMLPWSTLTRMMGRPRVILTPLALSILPVSLFQLKAQTFKGICPWS